MRQSLADLNAEISELEMLAKLNGRGLVEIDSCFNCGARASHVYEGRRRDAAWLRENGIKRCSGAMCHRIVNCGRSIPRLLAEKRRERDDRYARIRYSKEMT